MNLKCPQCGADVPHECPDGRTLEDRSSGDLRHDSSFLIFDQGRLRTLRLRVGRGSIREATKGEVRDAMRAMQAAGGRARAAKMTPEQRSEAGRRAANKRWGNG